MVVARDLCTMARMWVVKCVWNGWRALHEVLGRFRSGFQCRFWRKPAVLNEGTFRRYEALHYSGRDDACDNEAGNFVHDACRYHRSQSSDVLKGASRGEVA